MKNVFTILATMICSVFGCSAQDTGFKSIDVDEFEKFIADSTIVRLDVRTSEEYNDGHIAGTINIDVLKDDFESKALATLPKDKTIALYCRSGRRSKNAANILTKNGYKVVELSTGFNGWIGANKPVEVTAN